MAMGRFITFEGIDGAGKSSHLAPLERWLRERGHKVITTREPGGSPLGDQLRDLLVNTRMSATTETLLMFAARHEHIETLIRPALQQGCWVLSDRFTDASYAYQGAGRELGESTIAQLENWMFSSSGKTALLPDLTFIFDLDTQHARQRMQGRALDKFEQEGEVFFNRVRSYYQNLAAQNPSRYCLLDARQSPPTVFEQIQNIILRRC